MKHITEQIFKKCKNGKIKRLAVIDGINQDERYYTVSDVINMFAITGQLLERKNIKELSIICKYTTKNDSL